MHPSVYELAVFGAPTPEQVRALKGELRAMLAPFDLRLGREVAWHLRPPAFCPPQRRAAAAVFFGGVQVATRKAPSVGDGVPIVPIVSTATRVSAELPTELRDLNALAYDEAGPTRVATALLECAGLLPRQRRVFLSYRRAESTSAALQLFDELSARGFDVFLDTHRVAPGDAFQTALWHRLCGSDVLVMLDTATYFERRWTAAEFGRALAKGILVLRIGWPGVTRSPRTATAATVALAPSDLTKRDKRLVRSAVHRIALKVEALRSESIAVRRINLISALVAGVERIGGTVLGTGVGSGVAVQLPNGRHVVAYPAVGVPSAETLHEARTSTSANDIAVVFDPIGISPAWLGHLNWLGTHIRVPKWLKATDVSWDFGDSVP